MHYAGLSDVAVPFHLLVKNPVQVTLKQVNTGFARTLGKMDGKYELEQSVRQAGIINKKLRRLLFRI